MHHVSSISLRNQKRLIDVDILVGTVLCFLFLNSLELVFVVSLELDNTTQDSADDDSREPGVEDRVDLGFLTIFYLL